MTTAKPTRVAFLLDESGSMAGIKTVTLSALDEYLQELKQGEDISFSFVTFSAIRTQTIYQGVPVGSIDIDKIKAEYNPTGGTPLIDAAMKTILATEKIVQPSDNVVVVFQTDGQENSSKEYKLDALQAAIKEKTDAGWKFVFLGTDIDAYAQAAAFGVSSASTMSYDSGLTEQAFHHLAANTRAYASGVRGQSVGVDFTEQQKADAGDKFAPGKPAPVSQTVEPKQPKPIVDDIVI